MVWKGWNRATVEEVWKFYARNICKRLDYLSWLNLFRLFEYRLEIAQLRTVRTRPSDTIISSPIPCWSQGLLKNINRLSIRPEFLYLPLWINHCHDFLFRLHDHLPLFQTSRTLNRLLVQAPFIHKHSLGFYKHPLPNSRLLLFADRWFFRKHNFGITPLLGVNTGDSQSWIVLILIEINWFVWQNWLMRWVKRVWDWARRMLVWDWFAEVERDLLGLLWWLGWLAWFWWLWWLMWWHRFALWNTQIIFLNLVFTTWMLLLIEVPL